MEFIVCQRHNIMGVLFWVCPTGGHVPQVGVALKYSHLTECGPGLKLRLHHLMDMGHTV